MQRKVAILIPAYKRAEYTDICLKSIFEAQDYENCCFYFIDEGGNKEIFQKYMREEDVLSVHDAPHGLRNSIIEFIEWVKDKDFEYISKVDNDCLVPNNWLTKLIDVLETTDAEIISPNVSETQAAFKYGQEDTYDLGFRPSQFVGGLWTMEKALIENIYFERADARGIRGAFSLLHQIITLNEPRPMIGWTEDVTFDDVGHWGGSHPLHIKSDDHADYSIEVGRPIGWNVEACR